MRAALTAKAGVQEAGERSSSRAAVSATHVVGGMLLEHRGTAAAS